MPSLISTESLASERTASYSKAATVPAGCTFMVAIIGHGTQDAGDQTINSVTLAGAALTQRQAQANYGRVEAWTITGPQTGTLVVTNSAQESTKAVLFYFAGGVYSNGDVDTVTSNVTTCNISAIAGDYIIEGIVADNTKTYSGNTGQTEAQEDDIFGSKLASYYLLATGVVSTVTILASGNVGFAHVAVVIHSAVGNQVIWI